MMRTTPPSDHSSQTIHTIQLRGPFAMVKLLVTIIPALLVVAIAILSVQNATEVPLTFLNVTTIDLPIGIWLAFGLGIGMIGTALLLSLFGVGRKAKSSRS